MKISHKNFKIRKLFAIVRTNKYSYKTMFKVKSYKHYNN